MDTEANAGRKSRTINTGVGHVPVLEKKTRHVAVWDGFLPSTAMLLTLMQNNYYLDCVLIWPKQEMFHCGVEDISFMKSHLKHNSVRYGEVFVPKTCPGHCRMNLKFWIERMYERENCHIVQYVPITDMSDKANLPSKYYITNRYPLIENHVGIEQCRQLVLHSGFLQNFPHKHFCRRDQDHIK